MTAEYECPESFPLGEAHPGLTFGQRVNGMSQSYPLPGPLGHVDSAPY